MIYKIPEWFLWGLFMGMGWWCANNALWALDLAVHNYFLK